MNANGLVLILAGIWVITQIIGGHALQRLKVIPTDEVKGVTQ